MKYFHYLSCAAMLTLASCGINSRSPQSAPADSLANNVSAASASAQKGLIAEMSIRPAIKAGDSVLLRFTVKNNTDSAMRFCKWHTPFEPLLSKYLEVKNEKGEEMAYQGAMAKRIMPPPASSYLTVNAKDSISANVDLLKAFAITSPGKYTITYVGENMSGVKAGKDASFVYTSK